jgi:hypothetical protein
MHSIVKNAYENYIQFRHKLTQLPYILLVDPITICSIVMLWSTSRTQVDPITNPRQTKAKKVTSLVDPCSLASIATLHPTNPHTNTNCKKNLSLKIDLQEGELKLIYTM